MANVKPALITGVLAAAFVGGALLVSEVEESVDKVAIEPVSMEAKQDAAAILSNLDEGVSWEELTRATETANKYLKETGGIEITSSKGKQQEALDVAGSIVDLLTQ